MTEGNGGALRGLRWANRQKVIDALGSGPLPQVGICAVTGLSPATVTSIVRALREDGLVGTSPGIHSGRRATMVALAAGTPEPLVGVSLGRRGFDIAIWDGDEARIERVPWNSCPDSSPQPEHVARSLTELLPAGKPVAAAAVSMAGWVSIPDDDRRSIVFPGSYPLAGWVDPASAMAVIDDALGVRATLKNDGKMAALAEARMGAARGVENAIYLEASEGVGGAFIFGSKVFEGDRGVAGEIGHVRASEHGPRCWCGNRGCLEQLIGADALVPPLRALHPQPDEELSMALLVEDALADRELAVRIVAEAGRDAGFALSPLVQVLNISTVVVGGALAAAGPLFLEPIREMLAHLSGIVREDLHVLPAACGDDGMALGCLLSAADEIGLNAIPELKNA